jgi:arabinofuranosyltransferase
MIQLREHTYISALLLVAILGAVAHFLFGFSHFDLSGNAWGSDDAYISYRYAQNLVDGHGLVFNPGDKVEGYTNLLYTLLAAIFISIDPNMVYVGCFSFNILAYIATLLLFYWYLRRITDENRARIGFFVLCAAPVMWAWPASGLESSSVLLVQLGLFVAADLIACKYSNRLFVVYSCLAALAILLRADGFVFVFLSSMIFLLKMNYRCFISAVVIILPNTYYAKVSGSLLQRLESAAKLLYGSFKINAFFLYLIPVILGAFQVINKLCTKKMLSAEDIPLIPFISLALLAYWFYIGGDVFYERFLLILIPLSIIYIVSTLPPKWYLAVLLCFVILQLFPFKFD